MKITFRWRDCTVSDLRGLRTPYLILCITAGSIVCKQAPYHLQHLPKVFIFWPVTSSIAVFLDICPFEVSNFRWAIPCYFYIGCLIVYKTLLASFAFMQVVLLQCWNASSFSVIRKNREHFIPKENSPIPLNPVAISSPYLGKNL